MSAPRTNVEKQAKNHRGPLIGIIAVLAFVVVAIMSILYITAERGGTPRDATEGEAPAVTAGPETGSEPANAPATTESSPAPEMENQPTDAQPANN